MRVVVVGAGIIGAAIADALARRGVEVVVLDARPPGHGASRASAGILAPYVEAAEDSPLLPLGVGSLAMYDEFVGGAAARSGRSIEYARSGTLQVALSEPEHRHLRASSEWLARRGVAHQWLDAGAARALEPSVAPAAIGALRIPEHALVGVGSLVTALVQSARLAGARFESPAEVSRIVPRDREVEIRCGDRRLGADVAVVAAGAWTSRLRIDGVPPLPVRPVRGQLLHLRWIDDARPSHVVWGPDCYAVPWSDGSLLAGATMEEAGFDERTTAAGVATLAKAVAAILPAAAGATMIEARAGLRPATPDGLPLVGALPSVPRVWFATGHFRNGILLAPLTASLAERAIVDGDADGALAPLRPERFL
jgi:glycine oxidase